MNRGRVGEERGGKEMDGCPLTELDFQVLSFAHCLAHRLSIVRYCFRFAPPLHSCITYCFFICNAP
jgi:hypothetical protein